MVRVDKAGCAKPAGPTTRRQSPPMRARSVGNFPQVCQPGDLRPAGAPHQPHPGPGREGLRQEMSVEM